MTDHRAVEPNGIEATPLSAEMIGAIGRMEPPPAKADFWDRLQTNVEGQARSGTDPGTRARSRYRATLAAVAALLVAAMAGLQLRTALTAEPADDPTGSGPASTWSGPPRVDPRPGSTVSRPVESEGPVADRTVPDVTSSVPSEEPAPADTTVPGVASPTGPVDTDTTTGPPSTTGAPSGPVRLEAEDNDLATDGGPTWEGWQLWGNSSITHAVALTPGTYRISIMAQGVASTSTRPEMALRIDGQAVGSTLVDLDAYRLYSFEVTVGPAGARRLEVAFTNDPNRPDNNVDLKVDYTEIIPLG